MTDLELTAEERESLLIDSNESALAHRVLRIIDTHASDRAALIWQAERDAALAFEWANQAQAYRADANVAKDRVAELEKKFAGDRATFERLVGEKNAANARAEAAERDRELQIKRLAEAIGSLNHAESEAAALRAELAEWTRGGASVGVTCVGHMQQAKHMADAAVRAIGAMWDETSPQDITDAIAALRVEVERLRNDAAVRSVELIGKHNDLAAAIELLQEVWNNGDIPRKIGLKIQAFLSSRTAPSERAAAERKGRAFHDPDGRTDG